MGIPLLRTDDRQGKVPIPCYLRPFYLTNVTYLPLIVCLLARQRCSFANFGRGLSQGDSAFCKPYIAHTAKINWNNIH